VISSGPAFPTLGLSARYEELRDHAVTSRAAQNESWSLFIRRGMAAWMRMPLPDRTPLERRPPAGRCSGDARDEMVLVLAGMALGSTKEAGA
jgi:hypothetical protein